MPRFVGRVDERAAVVGLLDEVRAGLSGVLAIDGDPGVGKTALVDDVAAHLADFRFVRAVGVESEMRLGFAALHGLLLPLLDGLAELPAPQRAALEAAFGLVASEPPDLFLVGLATLTLLADAARAAPVLCLVDDAQWLDEDSLQVISFVGRRLHADRIALVFCVREPLAQLAGFPSLHLSGLDGASARELLALATVVVVEPSVADRLVDQASGNPLALIEVTRQLSVDELAGNALLPAPLPLAGRLEGLFLGQVRSLPDETQRLLLLVAAEPADEPMVVWRAADASALSAECADAAVAAGLLTGTTTLKFRHPMIRSAVYAAADGRERRAAHAALAAAMNDVRDIDRRAWHRAAATLRHADGVAAELEASAVRARLRGGYTAETSFLERAAGLTTDPSGRASRLLAAAQAAFNAGTPRRSDGLRVQAIGHLGTVRLQAEARRLEGLTCAPLGRFSESAAILLDAARSFAAIEDPLATVTLLEAAQAVLVSGPASTGTSPEAVGEAGLATPIDEQGPTLIGCLLDAFATLIARGHGAAAPKMRTALQRLDSDATTPDDVLRWSLLGIVAALELWDYESLGAWTLRVEQIARARGALYPLRLCLQARADVEMLGGDFAASETSRAEAIEFGLAAGLPAGDHLTVQLLAWQGAAEETRLKVEQRATGSLARGAVAAAHTSFVAGGLLELGAARYPEALGYLRHVCSSTITMGAANQAFFDIIEAGVRCGDLDTAHEALAQVTEHAVAAGTDCSLGLLARSRGLLADDAEAEGHFEESVLRLSRTAVVTELARTNLVYGEWLRRRGRRVDARIQLRAAHESFARMGAKLFADRARVELIATGERVRKRTVEATNDLTAQETRIARLASRGDTNPEIATQLFISSSTVEYHLAKVYRKLGVNSRRQLGAALTAPTP